MKNKEIVLKRQVWKMSRKDVLNAMHLAEDLQNFVEQLWGSYLNNLVTQFCTSRRFWG